jgi:hypothetical protein
MLGLQRNRLRLILRCIHRGIATKCDGWGVKMVGDWIAIEDLVWIQEDGNWKATVQWVAYKKPQGIKALWSILKSAHARKISRLEI